MLFLYLFFSLSYCSLNLSFGCRNHVPFRDSKLTRILQPALGGNANTAIICNITLAQVALWSSYLMLLIDFEKLFEGECDASISGIGAVLSQEGHPVEFYCEKLSEAWKKWTTYKLEFYVVIGALHIWEHYLIQREFILHTEHQALKLVNQQTTINWMHARCFSFIQRCIFSIKHKSGKLNRIVDALNGENCMFIEYLCWHIWVWLFERTLSGG